VFIYNDGAGNHGVFHRICYPLANRDLAISNIRSNFESYSSGTSRQSYQVKHIQWLHPVLNHDPDMTYIIFSAQRDTYAFIVGVDDNASAV